MITGYSFIKTGFYTIRVIFDDTTVYFAKNDIKVSDNTRINWRLDLLARNLNDHFVHNWSATSVQVCIQLFGVDILKRYIGGKRYQNIDLLDVYIGDYLGPFRGKYAETRIIDDVFIIGLLNDSNEYINMNDSYFYDLLRDDMTIDDLRKLKKIYHHRYSIELIKLILSRNT